MMCKASDVEKIKSVEMLTHMADVACTDPKTKGTGPFSNVLFGYDEQNGAWIGGDTRGNGIALEGLMRTTSQESYVIPVDSLKVTVKTKTKVWSKIKTKKSVQTVKIAAE